MTELTIVALPEAEDYVWKISSEKIPHMTLLYLGDVPDEQVAGIFEYLEHTTDTSLRRFGLSVDHRGTLGPEDADVVFFENAGWNIDLVKQARTYLLKNDDIKTAYDSVQQYPEWTPHLTLGYPSAPAHEDTRDYPGVHWVKFDRVALWTGDFIGGEIPLKNDDRMEVAMADPVADFLAHHGVKGMRWGVRKSRSAKSGGSDTPSKAAPKKAVDAGKPTVGKGGRITSAPKGAAPVVKKTHDISDEELRQRINRINMERQYSQLTAPAPSKRDAAVKFTTDLLLDVGKKQATAILTSVATSQVNKQLEKRGLPVASGKKKK